jgi:hypothetical protein
MPEYRYTDMSKKIYILLLLAAGFFTACSTVQNVPIDDAYYSPEIESPAPATTSAHKTAAPSSASSQSSSSIEYINVQDTTVTIRIKK